jgi:hypothetical protein
MPKDLEEMTDEQYLMSVGGLKFPPATKDYVTMGAPGFDYREFMRAYGIINAPYARERWSKGED